MNYAIELLLWGHCTVALCWAWISAEQIARAVAQREVSPPPVEPLRTAWRIHMAATAICCALLWEIQVVAWLTALYYVRRRCRRNP